MDRNHATRLAVILAVLALGLYQLFPTYQYFTKYRSLNQEEIDNLSDSERRKMRSVLGESMKLGLDLQGGMHLVLEMDESKIQSGDLRDAQDRVMQILSTRVDQFGVTEPTIARQGMKRILIQLPGVEDPERAKGLVGKLAQLEFHMVTESQKTFDILQQIDAVLAGTVADADSDSVAAQSSDSDTTSTASDTESPLDLAAADTTASAAADTSLFPEFDLESETAEAPAALEEERPFSSLIVNYNFGALYIPDDGARVQRINSFLRRDRVRAILAREDVVFLWSSESGSLTADGIPTKQLYAVNTKVELTGGALKEARIGPDPNIPTAMIVNFRLDRKGARTFSRLTAENVGKQLAIVLDNVIKSAPSIRGRIPNGEGQITGKFTDEEAKDLAIVMRAGALPVEINVIEERTVGPTLGADSLRRGLTAALVGLGLTALFLLIYYQFAGILAILALAMNLVIVLAVMAKLGAALSLPGIAGLVLSVAMAVDANVLIFERIREELRKSKTVIASIDSGYKNALSAIIDSNLTTMFAGIVLLYFGTGPIKGFAVTLCIGITASMFTALFMTRFFFDSVTRNRRLEKLSI